MTASSCAAGTVVSIVVSAAVSSRPIATAAAVLCWSRSCLKSGSMAALRTSTSMPWGICLLMDLSFQEKGVIGTEFLSPCPQAGGPANCSADCHQSQAVGPGECPLTPPRLRTLSTSSFPGTPLFYRAATRCTTRRQPSCGGKAGSERGRVGWLRSVPILVGPLVARYIGRHGHGRETSLVVVGRPRSLGRWRRSCPAHRRRRQGGTKLARIERLSELQEGLGSRTRLRT